MSDCLFCKMVNGDITPDIIYQNDTVMAFRDINPRAPTHILIIPRHHISSLNDLDTAQATVLGDMYLAAQHIASDAGVAASGYRTVINCGDDGGQTVYHLHMHLLGGRALSWPPG